ncbi:MAG: protein kinase [Pseudomonadales bacterium]|nr:protein kinase [Pseudomonadales bacterium]
MEFPSIPGYTIEKMIGQGGMASVYLATQESFGRHVALKVMAQHLVQDESFAKRFLREAKMVARLSHQSIVPVFDVGAIGNFHYIAMEHLSGGDLKQKMRAGLSLFDSIDITKAIAAGLHYAGSKGLVHRDIKPENILFREDGSPVISDFGIARNMDSKTNMTMTGAVIGTPHYMSPEQAEGLEVDPRCDLYSLGIIVYEMLTGHVPFTGDSAVAIGIKHITEDPELLPQDVAGFQRFIDQALAKSPDDRFQSGEEFIRALEDIEFNLSDAGGSTVVMSATDVRKSSKGTTSAARRSRQTGRSRTSAARSVVYRRSRDEAKKREKRTRFLLGGGAALVIGVAVALWQADVFVPGPDIPELPERPVDPALERKYKALLTQADQAILEKRYFKPVNENAQYYLTTLLALSPQNVEGRKAISRLFSVYLEESKAALAVSNLEGAFEYLNQASQISFYINDQTLLANYTEHHKSLVSLRQKALISKEKEKVIADLLVQAKAAFDDGALTAPSERNAYDLYQQVLLEDPDNQVAQAGIVQIAERFLAMAKDKVSEKEFGLAKVFVAAAVHVKSDLPAITEVQALVETKEEEEARRVLEAENDKVAEREQARLAREAELKRQREQINGWLSQAKAATEAGRFTKPADDSAIYYYEKVLAQEPANIAALQGKEKVGLSILQNANELIQRGKYEDAERLIAEAQEVVSSNIEVSRTIRLLEEARGQAKLNAWLAAAEKAIRSNRLSSPEKNSALFYYDQVLAIDPNNIEAQRGRENVGMRYIELSKNAIDKKQFKEASRFLDVARNITRSEVEIATTERMLSDARVKYELDGLLSKGEQALSRGRLSRPEGDNALAYFTEALSIAPNNARAQKGLSAIADKYRAFIDSAVKRNEFEKAQEYMASLKLVQSDSPDIITLQSEIADKKAKYDNEQARLAKIRAEQQAREKALEEKRLAEARKKQAEQIAKLMSEAGSLEATGRNDSRNRRLAEIYATVLKSGANAKASSGLNNTSQYEADKARAALRSRNLNEAEKHISAIAKYHSNFADLDSLQRELAQAKSKGAQISQLLTEAQKLIDLRYETPGAFANNAEPRSRLSNAYRTIDEARRMDARNPQVDLTLKRLEEKYTVIISMLMREDKFDDAQSFINDTRGYNWSGDRAVDNLSQQLVILKEEAAKRSVPKALGGF